MTPLAPTTGQSLEEKLSRSRNTIKTFLAIQEQWLARATDAHREGYCLEAISICVHQLHAIFRRWLWVASQNQSLSQNPGLWNDEYLFDMLLEASHTMMEDAENQELYWAAEKFELIDTSTAEHLRLLHNKKTHVTRQLFTQPSGFTVAPLRPIAEEFIQETTDCLQKLEESLTTFDQKISRLLR